MMGRTSPIGTNVPVYLATAILPFVVWSYTHQRMMRSFGVNAPLLSFPTIKLMDIAASAAIVEIVSAALIVAVVWATFLAFGVGVFMFDPAAVFYALTLSFALGISTGYLIGLMTLMAPVLAIIGYLLIPLYWMASGVFFIPDALPGQVRDAIYIFPLAHIIDFGRVSYFASYASDFASLPFVYAMIVGNTLVSMLIQQFLPGLLADH